MPLIIWAKYVFSLRIIKVRLPIPWEGLSISKDIGSKELIADNFIQIGKAYEKEKEYAEALNYADQALRLQGR